MNRYYCICILLLMCCCSACRHNTHRYKIAVSQFSRVRNLAEATRRVKQSIGEGTLITREEVCDMDKEFVEKFKKLIDEQMSNSELNVEDLSKEMGLSRVQLYRKTKSLTNYAPNELLRIARLKKAAKLLSSTDLSIAEICYEVGFTSPSSFLKRKNNG